MATDQERILKADHDAWLANLSAAKCAANIDYLAMMSDIEIPTDEEVPDNESEV